MTYEIIFDTVAIDYVNTFEVHLRRRIYEKVLSTATNPFRYFIRLEGRADYKLRVGHYRVIADIDQSMKRISVTLIGHRRNVYK
ncbi:MAG: type II toxin-antitoxin system RelE/ParE family toxin [Candidatus Woesearchaeota archaeon]